jgi:cytochrome c5
MRADAFSRIRSVVAPTAIVSSFLAATLVTATLSTGCRSAGAGGKVDPDPTMKAIVAPAEAAEIAGLPEGPGKTLVAERCLMCHSAALISQQRKDAAAWGRTLTQMRTWGTPIQDADQSALAAYLVEHFGPRGAPR